MHCATSEAFYFWTDSNECSSSQINRSHIAETSFHSYCRHSLSFKSHTSSFFNCQIVEFIFTICTQENISRHCAISITSTSKSLVIVATTSFCFKKFISPVIAIIQHARTDLHCFIIDLCIARAIHLRQSCLNSIQQCSWNIYWNFGSTCETLWRISKNFWRSCIINHTIFISSRDCQRVSIDCTYQNDFSCSCFSFIIQLFDCCNHSSREQFSFSICDCNTCCRTWKIRCDMWEYHIVCRHCSSVQIIHCKPRFIWVETICSHYSVLQVSKEIGSSDTHWRHQFASVNSRWSNSYHQIVGAFTFVGSSLYKRTLHHWSWFHRLSTHCRAVMNHHHLQ